MRVAIVNLIAATCDIPDSVGGFFGLAPSRRPPTDKQGVAELAIALANKGIDTTLFMSDCYCPEESISGSIEGLRIRYLPTRLKFLFPPAFIPFCPSLLKELANGKFDATICVDFLQLGTLMSILSRSLRDTRVIVWQDQNAVPQFPGNVVFKIFMRFLSLPLSWGVDAFLAKSVSADTFVRRHSLRRDVRIIAGNTIGVSTRDFRPPETPRDVGKTTVRILNIGRLHYQKDQKSLIRISKMLVDRGLPIEVIIKGTGPLRQMLINEIREMGLEDAVRVIDTYSPREGILELYDCSDVFALTSKYETVGWTVLEAMACGMPVVSFDINGPNSIVIDSETGYLVPSGNLDLFAARLQTLITEPPLREKMGNKAREVAVKCYDWDAVASRFIRVIESFYPPELTHR